MTYVSGNVYIREMRFKKAGEVRDGHAHNFDHTTYVASGGLRIEKLSEDGSVERAVDKRASEGRNWVLIKAGVRHRITALEDGTIGHCIYAHRTEAGETVEEFNGWMDAYS